MHSFFNESQKHFVGDSRENFSIHSIYHFYEHKLLFLMTEGVSSNVSSTARKGCLISTKGFSEGRVFSHLTMETVGGRDGAGDVFTLKERKNELA